MDLCHEVKRVAGLRNFRKDKGSGKQRLKLRVVRKETGDFSDRRNVGFCNFKDFFFLYLMSNT